MTFRLDQINYIDVCKPHVYHVPPAQGISSVADLEARGTRPSVILNKTRRSKIVSRASAISVENLLCATVPKIAFVIVLKDACFK